MLIYDLMYEVPMTGVMVIERRISNYLRRWLGLPRSQSNAALDGTSNYNFLSANSLKNS